jgi:hypothetical protein
MTRAEGRISIGLALVLGSVGLVLDFTGWYTVVGGLFGLLGMVFALLALRGRIRRSAFWLNSVALGVAVIVLIVFYA